MGLNRYAKRKDGNQEEIVRGLRRAGAFVLISDFPDLWVRYLKLWTPLEVKEKDKNGKWKWSSDKQRKFCEEQEIEVVGNLDEALRAIGAI